MRKKDFVIVGMFCLITMGIAILLTPEKRKGPKIREVSLSKDAEPPMAAVPRVEEGKADLPTEAAPAGDVPPAPIKIEETPEKATEPVVDDSDPLFDRFLSFPEGVEQGQWKHIVLHHSGTSRGNAAAFDKASDMNEEKKEKRSLSYHFVIGNGTLSGEGEIEAGQAWLNQEPARHCPANSGLNSESIGICLVGNFEKTKPLEGQNESLAKLVAWLAKKWRVEKSNILFHNAVKEEKTLCPGENFPPLSTLLEKAGL